MPTIILENHNEESNIVSEDENQPSVPVQTGYIVAADDQVINIEVLKSQLCELGVNQMCTYCYDGQETIDKTFGHFMSRLENKTNEERIQPVSFLLLDFQMPKKTGLEVFNEVKRFYEIQKEIHSDVEIIEPVYVFLTAYVTPIFKYHLKSLGIQHIYEKPI